MQTLGLRPTFAVQRMVKGTCNTMSAFCVVSVKRLLTIFDSSSNSLTYSGFLKFEMTCFVERSLSPIFSFMIDTKSSLSKVSLIRLEIVCYISSTCYIILFICFNKCISVFSFDFVPVAPVFLFSSASLPCYFLEILHYCLMHPLPVRPPQNHYSTLLTPLLQICCESLALSALRGKQAVDRKDLLSSFHVRKFVKFVSERVLIS